MSRCVSVRRWGGGGEVEGRWDEGVEGRWGGGEVGWRGGGGGERCHHHVMLTHLLHWCVKAIIVQVAEESVVHPPTFIPAARQIGMVQKSPGLSI